jgi:hypothetical protein
VICGLTVAEYIGDAVVRITNPEIENLREIKKCNISFPFDTRILCLIGACRFRVESFDCTDFCTILTQTAPFSRTDMLCTLNSRTHSRRGIL